MESVILKLFWIPHLKKYLLINFICHRVWVLNTDESECWFSIWYRYSRFNLTSRTSIYSFINKFNSYSYLKKKKKICNICNFAFVLPVVNLWENLHFTYSFFCTYYFFFEAIYLFLLYNIYSLNKFSSII